MHYAFHIEQLKSYGWCAGRTCPSQRSRLTTLRLFFMFGADDSTPLWSITRTTPRTVLTEKALAVSCGVFTTVDLVTMGFGGRLNILIPDPSHRLQILHCVVCGGISDGFLVYASSTSFIRVVHVVVGSDVSRIYYAALKAIMTEHLMWIYSDNGVMPRFGGGPRSHCVDMVTLEPTLALWGVLVTLTKVRQQPLPPAKHIIPTLIASWNRVKGGIDVYSRYLKNVKSKHFRLSPTATIWLRMLMSLVYNAHQSYLILQSHDFLMNSTLCTSIKNTARIYRASALSAGTLLLLSLRDQLHNSRFDRSKKNTIETSVIEMGHSFSYNKRKFFNTQKEWIDLRLSKRNTHRSLRCVLCCRSNHDIENRNHSRQGFKTSFDKSAKAKHAPPSDARDTNAAESKEPPAPIAQQVVEVWRSRRAVRLPRALRDDASRIEGCLR
ncbi:hypothetical protein PF008_g1533 [Phytophthora fragariae]|uniref:Uncharacterized protein n=1 Tax=Phytophthora fragariae TaxID=53985 RepID=A0A6G0SJR9_9STRA|nr:hypothetical protein PF008_g1533 [Phytophthora fragariae]